MSFLLIHNDLATIVPFRPHLPVWFCYFSVLLMDVGRTQMSTDVCLKSRSRGGSVDERRHIKMCFFLLLSSSGPSLQQLAPYLDAIFHWRWITEAGQEPFYCSFWSENKSKHALIRSLFAPWPLNKSNSILERPLSLHLNPFCCCCCCCFGCSWPICQISSPLLTGIFLSPV